MQTHRQTHNNAHMYTQTDYVIKGDTIHFKEDFSKELDDYYIVIRDYTSLSLEESKTFNYPIVLTKDLTHVRVGYNFNQLMILTKKISYIKLGYKFVQPICLNKNLQYLHMGSCIRFVGPIVLTKKLTHLVLAMGQIHGNLLNYNLKVYNHGIIFDCNYVLGKKITHLILGCNTRTYPLVLPPRLIYLKITDGFGKKIIVESAVKSLSINSFVKNTLSITSDNLPNGMGIVELKYDECTIITNNFPNDAYRIICPEKKPKPIEKPLIDVRVCIGCLCLGIVVGMIESYCVHRTKL